MERIKIKQLAINHKVIGVLLFYLFTVLPLSAQRAEVLFETTAGNIRIALYDETRQFPENHKDGRLRLPAHPPCHQRLYDSEWRHQ